MFSLNEKVVYPGIGVAIVKRVVEKKIGGILACFFELSFLHKDMTVLIPMSTAAEQGIRKISSAKVVDTVLQILTEPVMGKVETGSASNWSKRSKEYQARLITGKLTELCKIYRDLQHLALQKELSFGERELLEKIENLLAEEIAVAKNMGEEKTLEHLRALCHRSQLHRAPTSYFVSQI